MSIESVRKDFKKRNIEHRIMEFEVSSATVELAAQALDVIPARIAKTLSFKSDDGCLLVIAAGDTKIDNSKFKLTFGMKARMLPPEDALKFTGHEIGGVCPFAISNANTKIYSDISLQRFHTVFPACGSSNSAIELSCEELFQLSGSIDWVDVCKGWQVER